MRESLRRINFSKKTCKPNRLKLGTISNPAAASGINKKGPVARPILFYFMVGAQGIEPWTLAV